MALLLIPSGSLETAAAALDAARMRSGLRGRSRGGARDELEWPEIEAVARRAHADAAELQARA